jgi:hypothetical protein
MTMRTSSPKIAPRSGENRLCRIGGVCLIGAGAIYAVSAVLSYIVGAAPSGTGSYLKSLASHATASRWNSALWIVSDGLLLPAIAALYLVLRPFAKGAMIAAAGILVLFAVFDMGVTEPVSLRAVAEAQRYAATGSFPQQLAGAASASPALALLPVATVLSFSISSVGLLIVSLVMFRGVFSRPTAWAGIVASVEGIIGGLYPLYPPVSMLMVPSLIAFALWAFLSGSRLYSVSRPGMPNGADG